jgi:hypothetical protein
VWTLARFENGRLILVPAQEHRSRLKHLSTYQTLWRKLKRLPSGEIVEDLSQVEDRDLITRLSYGVTNFDTGLVACPKEPKPFAITYQAGSADEF